MKSALLAVLLSGAIFVPADLRSEEPEDAFDQRMREMTQGMLEAGDKLTRAGDKLRATEDPDRYFEVLDEYNVVLAEFRDTYDSLMPSKLDMWEARQRLIELIYDSADETVLSLYLIAMERKSQTNGQEKSLQLFALRSSETGRSASRAGFPWSLNTESRLARSRPAPLTEVRGSRHSRSSERDRAKYADPGVFVSDKR